MGWFTPSPASHRICPPSKDPALDVLGDVGASPVSGCMQRSPRPQYHR
ncbi:hypothetical protein ACNKHL_22400 [Shigella flexneri]